MPIVDLPASAVSSTPPQVSAVVTCCPMYFLPNAAVGISSTGRLLPSESIVSSAASRQMPATDIPDGMDWYSGDSSQPAHQSGGPRVDMLDSTDMVDFSGLLPKLSAGSSDLGNVDMADFLDDLLQPACGMSGDIMNLSDDCDFCSSADGVRATFKKLMEVTTSKS